MPTGNQDFAVLQQRCRLKDTSTVHTGGEAPHSSAGVIQFRCPQSSRTVLTSSDQHRTAFQQYPLGKERPLFILPVSDQCATDGAAGAEVAESRSIHRLPLD